MNPYISESRIKLYEEEASIEKIAAKVGLKVEDFLDFSLNVNPTDTSSSVIDAFVKAASTISHYPDLNLSNLRKALSEKHNLPEGNFTFGAGLDEVIKLISQAYLAPSDKVLLTSPSYPRFELDVRIAGGVPIHVSNACPWEVDLNAIREALSADHIAAVFLCTPNNPTGAIIDIETVRSLVTDFPDTQFIIDEALRDIDQDGCIPLVNDCGNITVMRTLSKFCGIAGARVGYAMASPKLIEALEVVRPPYNITQMAADAAVIAVQDHQFHTTTRQLFQTESQHVCAALKELPRFEVRGKFGNMVFVEYLSDTDETLAWKFAKLGILVVDAKSFKGLETMNAVRISVGKREKNDILIQAFREIAGY